MIKLENTEVYGLEAAVRGMRNPMNSWDKSDSVFPHVSGTDDVIIGEADLKLMKSLIKAGSDHRKFLRMINVTVDIVAPLYWWKEFDTYKVGTVVNSCSTMHKIHDKEFTIDDFSCEHLLTYDESTRWDDVVPLALAHTIVDALNIYRSEFLRTKDKTWWWQMIQLLPSSYNQRRTVQLNYEVLMNIFFARNQHKLDEWHNFCEWIVELPHMNEFIQVKG